jgi:GxxExxY protein
LPIRYKGKLLTCAYRADFVCFESVLVEAKALKLTTADDAQLINELKATGSHRGVLLNFGGASLEHKRLLFGPVESLCQSAKSVDEIYL